MGSLTGQRDAGRERITESQSVRETAKGVQSDVGHDPRPAGFNNHVGRADTVHFGSALLLHGRFCLENNSFPCAEGLSADAGRSDQAAS